MTLCSSQNAVFRADPCFSLSSHHLWLLGWCGHLQIRVRSYTLGHLCFQTQKHLCGGRTAHLHGAAPSIEKHVGFGARETWAHISAVMFSRGTTLCKFLITTESPCLPHAKEFLRARVHNSWPVIIPNKCCFTSSPPLPMWFWSSFILQEK